MLHSVIQAAFSMFLSSSIICIFFSILSVCSCGGKQENKPQDIARTHCTLEWCATILIAGSSSLEHFLPFGTSTAVRNRPVDLINYREFLFPGSTDCTVRLCSRYRAKWKHNVFTPGMGINVNKGTIKACTTENHRCKHSALSPFNLFKR